MTMIMMDHVLQVSLFPIKADREQLLRRGWSSLYFSHVDIAATRLGGLIITRAVDLEE